MGRLSDPFCLPLLLPFAFPDRGVFPPDLSQNQWLLLSPPLCLNLSPDACLAAEHREEALICTGCCIKGQPLGSLGGVWRGMKSSVLLKQSRKSLEVTVVAGETYPKQGFIGLSLSSHSSHIKVPQGRRAMEITNNFQQLSLIRVVKMRPSVWK